ncbi:hypothetical protein [Leptolyngbya sp. 7M]|uniref:hypothetical protein n=1 Tax=Leptolyngbya sp. 7M TaxID=2812896 RepID=UPI001B8AC2D3|nr:hypothetical protein [Leptolyngbya sp. 7M]QYO65381.1 hypothetical protein JVX88_00945 [Leptolyngbya sp. 7M]
METHLYNQSTNSPGAVSDRNSLASSVLQNIFGPSERVEPNILPASAPSNSSEVPDVSETPESIPSVHVPSRSDIVRNVLSRLDERKERAAVELGIEAGEVESLPFDLSTLESEGIFMNIDCRGFGSLVRQLEWKTLGVQLPENAAVRVSPPRAGLLPDVYRNKLMRGAAQAHNALNRYGFRFTLCETVWGTSEYKWIPWTAFEQFEHAYFRACETLSAAKAEVLERYDEILALLTDSFHALAEDSADRFQATVSEPFNRNEFIEAVRAQALGIVPTKEMIRDGLVITMKPKVIVLGSEMIAERNFARNLALETAKLDAESTTLELELDSKRRIEQLKVDEFADETRREREVKERIRNMKIEAARREAEEAVSPVKEGFAQITAKLFEAATEMAERMKDAKFVPGSLAKRARQMCEWYQLMNFTGDTSLEEVLGKLESAAGREVKQRSPEEMRTAITDLLRLTSVQSKKLLDEDRLSALEL